MGSARLAAWCGVNQAVLATSRQGSIAAAGFVSNAMASAPTFSTFRFHLARGSMARPMPLLLLGLRTRSSAWNASNCPLVSSPHLTPDLPHQLPKLVSYFFIKCLHGMLVLKHIAYHAASSEIVHGCVISVRRTKQAPTVLGDLCHEAIAAEASRKRHRAQSWATAAVSVGVLTC